MKPSLEEVKEYFKNAKEVRCAFNGDIIDITKNIEKHIYLGEFTDKYWIDITHHRGLGVLLWGDNKEGYAEIVSYKDESNKRPMELNAGKLNDFQIITNSIADLLEYKNNKYGNSALNPINIFNGKTKVGQRVDDKLSRIQNSDVLQKNDIVDLIGYLVIICKENDWTTFDEFKD